MPANTAIPAPEIPAPFTPKSKAPAETAEGRDPGEGECLRCYLIRMLTVHGCDGSHRWTIRWRDARVPRATALLRQLARRGGCCCDCEVIFNVWPDYDEETDNLPCAGVPAGVTEPCRPPSAYVQGALA